MNQDIVISSGQSVDSITLDYYDYLTVQKGGQVGYVEILDGASLEILSGGSVGSVFAEGIEYCEMYVSEGGKLTQADIGPYCWAMICSGASVTGVVENGGRVDVLPGAHVTFAPHEIPVLTVNPGQEATIHAGTTVNSAYVTGNKYYGGLLDVYEGATLSNITVTSNGQLNASGSISDVMVESGGYVNAVTATMEGVYLYNGGRGVVYSTGVGSDVTIYHGGSCNVNGGKASLVRVSSGGSFTVENVSDTQTGSTCQGVASTTTVMDGGVMRLVSGASADRTTVSSGGLLDVLSGGTATNVVVEDWSGCKYELTRDTYIDGTCGDRHFTVENGNATACTIESQSLNVSDGCSIDETTIGDGGSVFILDGGMAEDTFVQMDGSMYVSAGGRATRTFIQRGGFFGFLLNGYTNVQGTSDGVAFETKEGQLSGYRLENGRIDIEGGGLAISTTVVGSGILNILGGGVASATTVSSGGQVTLAGGAKAIGITVGEEGRFTVSSGGTVTGRMTFESGAYVSLESGAILDFDLTRTTAGAAALVNDLSFIDIAPTYTLTVNQTETDGTYKLARGAEYFNSTITVRNTSGKNLGMIRTGETLTTAYADYTLNLTDGELSLTISNSTAPGGDVLLANVMPQAEYMYGCGPTAVSMILGYYDLYGYHGKDFSDLIDGVVEVKSRGTDGNKYNMNAFDTVLGRATATQDYVYRFYSRGDIDVITQKKSGTYSSTTPVEELEYSFTNGGAGPDLRTDDWNCIADYLGTGQIWRGNNDLSTNYTIATLESDINANRTITYTFGDISRTIDWRYTSMLYGLYLYVQDKGYSLDLEITGTYRADVAGGSFTFEDYMDEINAGRPVLISIEGHAMTGYGYNADTREIIFDDCYEANQRMVWGGTYHYADADRPIKDITVIGLVVEANVDLLLTPVTGASSALVLSTEKGALVTEASSFAGSPVYLSFAVKNQGESASGAFAVSLFVDGVRVDKLSPFDLGSGDSAQQKNIQLPSLSVGLHSVSVVVDEDNDVPETSGSNNTAEQKLMVLKAGTNVLKTNEQVQSGVVSTDDYVASGWQMTVLSGGTAVDTIVQGIVTQSSGEGVMFLPGTVTVLDGGLVRNTDVYEYGSLELSGAGESVHVRELGEATVGAGATLSGVTVDAGGSLGVAAGGEVTGRIAFNNGADVQFESGAVLSFDLTQTSAGAASLVNDLTVVQGAPDYAITVVGTEANGTYNLADGAAGFDRTITVKNTSGVELGTISVGGQLSVGSVDYRLNLTGSTLSLTVEASAVTTFDVKFDVNGSGISDVMFVWSGNDYAHGYWLDGTNTWRSTGSNHPAEWENLGCYDMTGDGKADSVLVGNVVVDGRKGAYIGYYADAVDAIDGSTWVNIDYLNNEANIVWKNKIGNLTGGAANSIVWYAPELYTLGAWTDGTSSWTTITGSFGGDDWKLVGCGDFDGDGKDSVVMSGAGGAYFYAADLDGTVTSLGAANWSGWTVRAIGDFLGDGKDDMVLFHEATGSMVMLANGNLDDFTSIGQLDALDWFVVGCGDYNADQKDDLLVRQYSTGMLGYYSSGDVANGWVELGRGVGMEWTVIA